MSDLDDAQNFLTKYTLYKRATEYIGGWIAETAASIGFEVQKNDQSQPQVKAKPKKRGGKKNTEKAKAKAAATAANDNVFQVRVADFIPMAKAIAGAGDARHEHFIQVLEDTFATLRPFLRASGLKTAQKDAPLSTQEDLTTQNRFAALTVEEAAALADEEDVSELTLPKVSKIELQQDEDNSDEEFWITLSLLLQEQQDLRKIVRESWSNYKDGKVDLTVAAMVTDTAIRLAQKSEAEFELRVTRPEKWPVEKFPIATFPAILFYNSHDTMRKWSLEEIAKPSNTLGTTAVGQTEAHFDFWPVYTGLKFYLHKHMTKKTVPQVVPKDLQDPEVHDRTIRSIEFAQIMRLIKEAPKQPKLWDLVSQGVLKMFSTHTIPMWLTFGVQLHFDSQDILGEQMARTHFELNVYLNAMVASVNDIRQRFETAEDLTIPDSEIDALHEPIAQAFGDIDPWANRDGFSDQWAALSKNRKVAGHPTLKLLKSENMYFFRRHPLLNGMMKYHWFLHWHALGLSYEATSTHIFTMAHVYVATRVGHQEDPVWPDMEFALYNQDPRYVLRTYGQLGAYSPDRLNYNRSDLGLPRYDPTQKSRLFRDASVFGETVYLPRGVSGSWIDKIPGGAFHGQIDKITRALLSAQDPNATRGRLARAMKPSENSTLEPLTNRNGFTFVAILQHYAVWLEADMADLCFDWFSMQSTCTKVWRAINLLLSRKKVWQERFNDIDLKNDRRHKVANAIISTGMLTGCYPDFIDAARWVIQTSLRLEPPNVGCLTGEKCLRDMLKFHPRTASMFRDNGPLSIDVLFQGQSTKQEMKEVVEAAVGRAREQQDEVLKTWLMAQQERMMMDLLKDLL
ncbi:unnamed protein product [Periconia digitata]|uniref:DUF6604 domain-containing protein n=1 Tax=Periconia digitata TaxID=1303443 RepID=A0A9W4XH88_9PLEO|nr:unnamed protein product [Periconia digitata]